MDEAQVRKDLIRLTGLSPQDFATLRESASVTQQWTDEVVQIFYDTLFDYEPTAEVFREGERPAREQTLHDWYHEVTGGNIDEAFWQHQWFVGLVHIPRKITNPYMLGMMSRVQQTFRARCLEAFAPERAEEVYGAFKRVTDVIAGLIAEGYFQSYVEAVERTSGQSKALIDRMVGFAVKDMMAEARGG